MHFIPNGLILYATESSDIVTRDRFFKEHPEYVYHGVHEFYSFPLDLSSKDSEIRRIANEQFGDANDEDAVFPKQFISDERLLREYVEACDSLNYSVRLLFAESTYQLEEWTSPLPEMTFLGYEVCEIPLDACTIYDLFLCPQFEKYVGRLNENGLFSKEEDAVMFMNQYNDELAKGLVGDGEVDLYVCKVYEVDESSLMELIK